MYERRSNFSLSFRQDVIARPFRAVAIPRIEGKPIEKDLKIQEIATPVCATLRNDSSFEGTINRNLCQSEFFDKANDAAGFLEAYVQMEAEAVGIMKFTIAGKFGAALGFGPGFAGLQ